MIEHGNSQALKNLLSQSASHQVNRSTSGSGSQNASEISKADHQNQVRMSCMRMDRHFSALVFACYTNQLGCLQILFEHGKELTTSKNHEIFIKEWLGGTDEQRDCLFYAVNHDNADMFSYLLDKVRLGARINDKDESGQSLLHVAAQKGNERIIFELAGDEPGYGADVNSVDANQNTPLHIAARANKPSAARFLLSLGANLHDTNNDRDTPLHASVQAGNLRTCKDLLLKGAERSARNGQG